MVVELLCEFFLFCIVGCVMNISYRCLDYMSFLGELEIARGLVRGNFVLDSDTGFL